MLNNILGGSVITRLALAGAIFAYVSVARAEVKIVAIGDSNLDVPHIAKTDMYPAQLERVLRERGHKVTVTNAGQRGDTTQGVLQRLDRHVPDGTDIALVGIGANDTALFKVPREIWTANLTTIVKRLRARGIEVLVFGVGNLNNAECCFGKAVATETDALFYRHFQDGLYNDMSLHSEKIKPNPSPTGPVDKNATAWHLNEKGNVMVVERTLPLVEALIARVDARTSGAAKPNP